MTGPAGQAGGKYDHSQFFPGREKGKEKIARGGGKGLKGIPTGVAKEHRLREIHLCLGHNGSAEKVKSRDGTGISGN